MSASPCIVWLRQDLRLADNPALVEAAKTGRPLILLYILDDETAGHWRMGAAARWWLHHSLEAFAASLKPHDLQLVLRRGVAAQVLDDVIAESGAGAVFWNRCYEPYATARDAEIKSQLGARGLDAKSFNASLMFEPWTVQSKSGDPYKVFTPFSRACLTLDVRAPLRTPKHFTGARRLKSDDLAHWKLTPSRPNWAKTFPWRPGEVAAHQALSAFIDTKLDAYPSGRDQLGLGATSRLSAHLHFGELSPVQVRAVIGDGAGSETYLKELIWREFSYHVLYHAPELPSANWKKEFDRFAWRTDEEAFTAWCKGRTGYPVVDAAMRELWATGYMHNRARMIAASFLTKHLLIDWRRGGDWFWDTLVDADLANNSMSWQWVAGSGADAAPYFRIFNPVTQGERFDTDGAYVRKWIPELSRLSDAFIHQPWTSDAVTLAEASVVLGKTYPAPIVDHKAARTRALAAYAKL